MTDITDRHTLRRMSWSELFTAAQEAEFSVVIRLTCCNNHD